MQICFKDKFVELIDFIGKVDSEHPNFVEEPISRNSDQISQILDMTQYAVDHGLDSAIELIGDASHLLGDTRRKFRFFDARSRSQARSLIKPFKFSSRSFYESCARMWHSCSSDFSCSEERMETLRKASKKFKSMGCERLAASTEEMMGRFVPKNISMNHALCVMAKANNFTLSRDNGRSYVVINTSLGSYLYVPSAIPFYMVSSLVPDHVMTMVNSLDSPHAAFDNYFVLVPSLGHKIQKTSRTCVLNFDAPLSDEEMVSGRAKCFLVGDVDGELSFICAWG